MTAIIRTAPTSGKEKKPIVTIEVLYVGEVLYALEALYTGEAPHTREALYVGATINPAASKAA
jgi:hypothetical protein